MADPLAQRIANPAEGNPQAVGLPLRVMRDVELLGSRNGKAAHHHGQDRAEDDLNAVTISQRDELRHGKVRVGASERNEGLDSRLRASRIGDGVGQRWNRAANESEISIQSLTPQPFFEEMKSVDTPIPIATVVDHARLVMAGTLECGVVGLECGANVLTRHASVSFDDRGKGFPVVSPHGPSELGGDAQILLGGTGLEQHGMGSTNPILRRRLGIVREAQAKAVSQE